MIKNTKVKISITKKVSTPNKFKGPDTSYSTMIEMKVMVVISSNKQKDIFDP